MATHAERQKTYRLRKKGVLPPYVPKFESTHQRNRRTFYKKFGMTIESFDAMAENQGGRCLICGIIPDKRLSVDHNHKSGLFRGLLCSACNMMLGYARDNVQTLAAAIEYLNSKSG